MTGILILLGGVLLALIGAVVVIILILERSGPCDMRENFLHGDRELVEPTPDQRAEVRRAIRAFRPSPKALNRSSRPIVTHARRSRTA